MQKAKLMKRALEENDLPALRVQAEYTIDSLFDARPGWKRMLEQMAKAV